MPHSEENIVFPETGLPRSGTRCGPFMEIEILPTGGMLVANESMSLEKLEGILKESFAIFGNDYPILLHIDKNVAVSKIRPLIKSLVGIGKYRAVLEAKSTKNGRFYPFVLMIDKRYAEPDITIKISEGAIEFNGKPLQKAELSNYLKPLEDKEIMITCDENLNYQKLIDIMTICHQNELKHIDFIIE